MEDSWDSPNDMVSSYLNTLLGYHELSLHHDDAYQLSCPFQYSVLPSELGSATRRCWTVRGQTPTSPLVVQSCCCSNTTSKVRNNLLFFQNMFSRVYKTSARLSAFSRRNLTRPCITALSSPVQIQYSTESKTKSEEPLAQRLNIDDPESGDLREKTQSSQSKVENMTEPPTSENSSTSQPTQEPVAQMKNKDEPPHDGLRGQTHEAMSKSENTKET